MSVLRVTETKLFKELVQDAELIEVGEIDLDDGEIPNDEGSPQPIKIRSFPIRPNSNLVSAIMMPRLRAYPAAN